MASRVIPAPVKWKTIRTLGDMPVKLKKSQLEKASEGSFGDARAHAYDRGLAQQYRALPTEEEELEEQVRARKATANRIWATLRAALNRAYREHGVSDEAWRRIEPFKGTEKARVRFLEDDEAVRLVNACSENFRQLVTAALLTGCRYSELARLRYEDFQPGSGTIFVRTSKSGKSRHVPLPPEGMALFIQLRHLSRPGRLLLVKANGKPWSKSQQEGPMRAAYEAAKIEKANFHSLRHTYASRLIQGGAHLKYVAELLGHRDTTMVELHYGHLAKSDVKRVVCEAFKPLGIVEGDNVEELKISA
jgi:integrase